MAVIKGRGVAALVNIPWTTGFVAYADYVHDFEGLSPRNLEFLQTVRKHIAGHGRPLVLGANFNFDPMFLESIDSASKLKA